MENSRIRIESDGIRTEFYVDGKKIEDAHSLHFEHLAGEKPICNYSVNVTIRNEEKEHE